MKQLLSLFLLLLPYLVLAQYPSNGNQKITLGEQTTADGLIYRGVAATDTVRKSSVDTMAYMVLDTTTNIMWHYKKATSNAWLRLNLLPSDTASMFTNYYRSGRTGIIQASDVPTLNQNTTGSAATLTTSRTFQTNLASTSTASFNGSANVTPGVTGTLPVANGGTNTSTAFTAGSVVFAGSGGTYTQSNSNLFHSSNFTRIKPVLLINDATNIDGSLGIQLSTAGSGTATYFAINKNNDYGILIGYDQRSDNGLGGIGSYFRNVSSDPINFLVNNATNTMQLISSGDILMGYLEADDKGAYKLQINGQPYATSSLFVPSDESYKENITPLNKGLEIINKLKPVTFNFITNTENNFSEYEEVGFIAQEVDRALSTETFAKSIVKSTDDSMPTAKMGLMTQNLIPILTKAIQEQQALIKALEQRIINLENK